MRPTGIVSRRLPRCLPAALAIALLAVGSHAAAQEQGQSTLYLETELKALTYRSESLQATAEQDVRILGLKRSAIEQARRIEQTALQGHEAFLAIHRSFFSNLIEAVLPFTWARDGYTFTFYKVEIDLVPEGILAKLSYRVVAEELRALVDTNPEGQLRCGLSLIRGEQGGLFVRVTPQLLSVHDRYYRAHRLLLGRFTPQVFAGFLPDLPVPLSLPSQVAWEGRTQSIDVQLDPARMLVLPERVILPFSLTVGGAPSVPAESAPPAAAPAGPTPAKIPVGLTPQSQQPKIPVGLTPQTR